jgi:nucleoside-diphosphate-sugar epimerase
MAGCDRVVVAVPPTPLGDDIGPVYERLVNEAVQAGVPHLLHTSSTGVYDKTSAHPNATEANGVLATTPRAARLLAAERAVLAHPGATVLRLAGLIGPDRHPIDRMAGRERPGGAAPVNLVHRDDVTTAITLCLERGGPAGVFNIVADAHPSRDAYYTKEAARRGVPPPRFTGGPDPGVVVSADAFQRATGWQPRHRL